MSYLEKAKKLRADMDLAGSFIRDDQAVKVKNLYRQWDKLLGSEATPGLRFLYGEDLYKVIGAKHTFSAQWVPGLGTESLYARIDESHAGTIDEPVPYEGNMELVKGMYYSQGGVIYLCTISIGQPVYHALSELVGLYVEVVG